MAVIPFPANLPASAEWQLVSHTKTFKSPLNGSIQTSETPGARWHVSLTFPNQTPAEGRVLMAFLARLRGESGRFSLHDHTLPTPRGTIIGTPAVSGVAQTGASIMTKDWTGTLLAGDYISIGGELKMVTLDVTGTAAVPVSVAFEPPLRSAPANNSLIVINKPTATFKLTGDNQAKFNVSPIWYNMSLVAVETF